MIGLRTMIVASALVIGSGVASAQESTPVPLQLDTATKSRCLKILNDAIISDEFWPAMHAAEALSQAGYDKVVIEKLTPQLSTITDGRMRCGVARELVRAGQVQHVDVLLSTLASNDSYAHTHACESLYKVKQIGDGKLLRAAMENGAAPVTALMAAGALARSGDQAAYQFLRTELKNLSSENNWIAAWILGVIGDEQDIPSLERGLKSKTKERDRAYFEHALALRGDAKGKMALKRNFKNTDPVIRADAAYMAGDAGMLEAKSELINLLGDAHFDVRIRAAQGLLTLAQAQTQHGKSLTKKADSKEPGSLKGSAPKVVLTLSPGPENCRNSEGDFIQTKDGRILFIYSRFGDGRGGDHDVAELRERVSTDGGKTWSKEERVIVKPDGGLNVMSVSLLRLQTGEIALFYLAKVSLEDCRPIMRISTDEGKTWGPPTQCITDEIEYYVLNNNRAIQLKNGRIILPVCLHRQLPKPEGAKAIPHDWKGELMCYLSDDNGKTWRRSKSTFIGKDESGKRLTVQEPGVIELKDGRVLMYIRSSSGTQMLSYSSDGGDTWTEPQTSNIISPLSPASIERIPQTGDLLLVWNNHENISPELKGFRTPLTVAVSKDEGQTWTHVKNLFTDPNGWYCYIAIDIVGDSVLLGHCAGVRGKSSLSITDITRFDLDWLYDK